MYGWELGLPVRVVGMEATHAGCVGEETRTISGLGVVMCSLFAEHRERLLCLASKLSFPVPRAQIRKPVVRSVTRSRN
jgi:hypothetical protein